VYSLFFLACQARKPKGRKSRAILFFQEDFMNIQTHQAIARDLCGDPVSLSEGRSLVRMRTSSAMSADSSDLVHGGFVFGMADYAAMLAVNHPNVVLGSAESFFLKPVKAGELLEAEASVEEESGRKRKVEVTVRRGETVVMTGIFMCFVLDKHVLA
jgi:acyl-coenzyme A thioesterase PaaI-like protein